jgi:alpha-galactosidase
MPAKKIVCLGGGSLYFRRAIPDLLVTEDLAGSEIVVYDLDDEKAALVAGMGQRIAAEAETGCTVRAADGLADAVDGADFAVSSIGGSGAEVTQRVYQSHYHAADIRIPQKYGIQQVVGDTCGPAGMMMGLRSIPAYMEICREMEKRCPRVVLFSHSNPMAVLCRAMTKYTDITTIGVCHGVQGGIKYAAEILELPPEELNCAWVGTNHYYWLTRVTHQGRDLYPELMARVAELEPTPARAMARDLSLIYGYQILYPQDDHIIEFYPFGAQCRSLDELPYDLAEHARKRDIDEDTPMPSAEPPSPEVREAFFAEYAGMMDDTKLPEKQDDTLTAEGIGAMVSAIATGRRQVCIVNIPNEGAIPNLPATALVEIEGVTDSTGVRGVSMGECPLVLKGILEKRFVWQELVADAAVTGDRNLALQALMVDEMAIPPKQSEAMLDELLAASKDLLPQFA